MGDHCTSVLKDSSVRPAFQRMFALKDKSVRPPTLAQVPTKRQTSAIKIGLYVHTKDRSVHPLNLAYVSPKVQIAPLMFLETQSPN
jgi:hypothetical protein